MKVLLMALAVSGMAHAANVMKAPVAPSEQRAAGHKTADTQMTASQRDMEMTRRIRERLVEDESLSVYAENVTIVTLDGKTTLRGTVKNRAEADKVSAIAKDIAGTNQVTNKLTY